MTALLAAVGVAVGFGLGVWWARRRRALAPPESVVPEPVAHPVIERHPDGVVLVDKHGAVVFRNATARELQGTHVGVLVNEAIDRHAERALAEGRSDDVLELYGPPRVALVIAAVRLDDGGVAVFIDDISERSRIERVRTDFVANITHELKTPVGAMSVLAETLEGENDPSTVARVVARIVSEAHRASRTIDDLMELSRIETAGKHEAESIRVEAVVTEAMERVTELASQRKIGLTNLATVDQLAGVRVAGDRHQLVSALGNLVENAVKYSEPGGQVAVRTRVAGDAVELAVIDQGVGIPQQDLDRVFERFYRVDRARSRATGGTGLGLSIVRNVATNHGGEVLAESTEGEGSVFTLRLPLLPPQAAEAARGELASVERGTP